MQMMCGLSCRCVVVFIATCFSSISASSGWGYRGDTGPSHWKDSHPICGHKKQSPIDIETASVMYDSKLTPILLTGYDVKTQNLTVMNNGHTAQFSLPGELTIAGGKLDGEYRAAQFHFHWGKDASQGSEHTVNKVRYPLEMHIVHYSTKYPSLMQAMDQPDGLAVLGVFFKISEKDNMLLDWITGNLNKVMYKGQQTVVSEGTTLREVVSLNLDKYYSYSGSLTTPPCYQSVTWTVFADPIGISENQLSKFRSLYETTSGSGHSEHVEDNFRPVQPLGDRTVYSSFPPSSASSVKTGYFIISLIMIVLLLHIF